MTDDVPCSDYVLESTLHAYGYPAAETTRALRACAHIIDGSLRLNAALDFLLSQMEWQRHSGGGGAWLRVGLQAGQNTWASGGAGRSDDAAPPRVNPSPIDLTTPPPSPDGARRGKKRVDVAELQPSPKRPAYTATDSASRQPPPEFYEKKRADVAEPQPPPKRPAFTVTDSASRQPPPEFYEITQGGLEKMRKNHTDFQPMSSQSLRGPSGEELKRAQSKFVPFMDCLRDHPLQLEST